MIKPDISRPGFVTLVDVKGRRHIVSASAMGQPQATGPRTTYVKITGYENLFVSVPIGEVQEAVKRARTLRKAARTAQLQTQMELDFRD
jgi:hypothetical protein